MELLPYLLLLAPVAALLVFRDAYSQGMNNKLWALVCLFCPPWGWVAYAAARLVHAYRFPLIDMTRSQPVVRSLEPPQVILRRLVASAAGAWQRLTGRGDNASRAEVLVQPPARQGVDAGGRLLELDPRRVRPRLLNGPATTTSAAALTNVVRARPLFFLAAALCCLLVVAVGLWFWLGGAGAAGLGTSKSPRAVTSQFGSMKIIGADSADVYVDGTLRGKAPLELDGLAAGPHQVIVTKPGHKPYSISLQIKAGRIASVTPRLEEEPAP